MKPQEFIKLLRRVIREEVTDVVNTQVRLILNEEIDSVKLPIRFDSLKQTKRPLIPREYPLVTMDDFLNETRQSMAGFDDGGGFESMGAINSTGEQEFDPELAVAPSQTAHLVKDYSSLLKRADEIANNSRG